MAFGKLWVLALRDLGRNRRRSILSLVAVSLGLALLIFINGFIAGVVDDSLQNNIRLNTGHLQIRAESYRDEVVSLQWKDLLGDLDALMGQVNSIEQVAAAAPLLRAGGILGTKDDSVGLQILGIDVTSDVYAPIRQSVNAGAFLSADDRDGIVLGQRLAESMGIGVDSTVSITLVDADGLPQEAIFTVRGLFSTGIVTYDESSVLMPLAKAQSFTHTEGRATAVTILLHKQEDADGVAAALRGAGLAAQTWEELNSSFISTLQTAMGFYVILDMIVMLIVAVIIANTLLMSVFERFREIGILASLGMKARQVMQMFLYEATILGFAGIVVGVLLGGLIIWYLSTVGMYLGDDVASAAGSAYAMSSTIYARFVPSHFVNLSLGTLAITLLASLYPAWFAARKEPVDALRAL
ncbi:MAG: ABC transporter permease [Caldilineaceae bacterium]|nr:ABC transporter permease [Caldilineaceae bacterium]HRJ42275.1 ABC transporter permease [Caldilineaceae bacterium]